MEKEYLSKKSVSYSVNITASKVDSLRKTIEKTNTVRVYDDGKIGICGEVGKYIPEIEQKAIKNLTNNMSYPCQLSCHNRVVDLTKPFLDADKIVSTVEQLVSRLDKECGGFLYSNKVQYYELDSTYRNSKQSDLQFKANFIAGGILIKDKKSANLMDMGYDMQATYYDEDEIVKDVKMLTDAYGKHSDIDEGEQIVLLSVNDLLGPALNNFVGESYALKASLFNGKAGQKLFNENFSLVIDKTPDKELGVSFFDDEGEISNDDKTYIVRNGVLSNFLTTKKTAQQYNLANSCSAVAPYDAVPGVGVDGLTVCGDSNLQQLLGSAPAIYVNICSGGDMTTSGDFATPVQCGFLYQNGALVGRLPELKIYGNIYDILGKGFVGCSTKTFFRYGRNTLLAVKMQVSK